MALLLLAAGCGHGVDRSKPVTLPSPASTGSTSASTVPSTSLSAEDSVRAAYVRYWEVMVESRAQPDRRSLRNFLARYLADPFLTYQVGYAELRRQKHQVIEGRFIPHITSVKVAGNGKDSRAYVADCQDASGVVIRDSRTGKVVKGSRGSARRSVTMTFVRTPDGRWFALDFAESKKKC
ncbi:hypothetical protein [Actinomadura rayongensis]|uniref:Uncharacterized protein n=1 Tax=Actinomadura rayongensis TaxID=1429076 RepID=A0A6I4WFA9_9ACTN|nr:hypothetical protein [Actinomadura rayongensis]MXQ65614.1 hypothetical protein [Actinomadura rayongensis]